MFAAQFALLFLGMYAGVPAGLAAIIDQIQVFFTVLLAILFLDEKVHIWQIIGGIVAFGGIVLIGFNFGSGVTVTGFVLVAASAAMWSVGNLSLNDLAKSM